MTASGTGGTTAVPTPVVRPPAGGGLPWKPGASTTSGGTSTGGHTTRNPGGKGPNNEPTPPQPTEPAKPPPPGLAPDPFGTPE